MYYSDLEFDDYEDYEDYLEPLFAGDSMSGATKHGKLFIISGPSGVGKTTIASAMLAKLGRQYNIDRVITYTTKQPRKGETGGIDYHYLSVEDFENKLSQDFFMEYSQVYGNYYGSPSYVISELKKGKSFILVVDQVGAYKIKEQYSDAVLIWLTPPSIEVLKLRLEGRNSDHEGEIARRLQIASREMLLEKTNSIFDYVVVNDDLDKAMRDVELVLISEVQEDVVGS